VQDFGSKLYFAVLENIHTYPTEGIFSKTSPPLWNFQSSFIYFFTFLIFQNLPPLPPFLPRNSHPFRGGVWKSSGTVHCAEEKKMQIVWRIGWDYANPSLENFW